MNTKLKDRSEISTITCITEYLLNIFIGFFLAKAFMFIPIERTVVRSLLIMLLCIVASSFVGCIVRWKKCMTVRGTISDIIIGIGIYMIAAYKAYYKTWFVGMLLLFLVCFIILSFIILTRKIHGRWLIELEDPYAIRRIIKRRVLNIYNYSGLLLAFIMLIMAVPIIYNHVVNGGIIAARVKQPSYETVDSENTYNKNNLDNNIEMISKIRNNETWKPLSLQEKLNVLQVICDREGSGWGLDSRIRVVMNDNKGTSLGSYIDKDRIISFEKRHLEEDDSKDVLNTCLHEMYHAYEHCLVRLYLASTETQRKMSIFNHCSEYVEEIMNYQGKVEDFETYNFYSTQRLEADSRLYAIKNIYRYYDEIDAYKGRK